MRPTRFRRRFRSPRIRDAAYNLAIAQLENKNKLSAISQYNLLADSDPNFAKQLYRVLYGDKVIFAGDYER